MKPTFAQASASLTPCVPFQHLITKDLTEIPLFELSDRTNHKDALLVLHATGFSGCTYRALASHLSNRWDVFAIDFRGHGRSKKRSDETFHWVNFAKDVDAATKYIKRLGYDKISVFGHSMGAAAAILSLELGDQDIDKAFLFEPIIFKEPEDSAPNLDNPLAKLALRRRSSFDSYEAAYDNFTHKEPICRFLSTVVIDYLLSAFKLAPDGTVSLSCTKEDESLIYAFGGSHGAYHTLDRISNDVTILFGADTDTFDRTHFIDLARRLPKGTYQELKDTGHFAPMTHPEMLAKTMIKADHTNHHP